jgi:hypothetical protein
MRKGRRQKWDNQIQELMEAKGQRFPKLMIEGVDKKIESASHVWGPRGGISAQPYEDPDDTDTEVKDPSDYSDDSLRSPSSFYGGEYAYRSDGDGDGDEENDKKKLKGAVWFRCGRFIFFISLFMEYLTGVCEAFVCGNRHGYDHISIMR